MVGNNELILCEAQMIAIVQAWVNRYMISDATAKVASVKAVPGSDTGFRISLREPTIKPLPAIDSNGEPMIG